MNDRILAASQDYPLLNLFWTMLWFFLWILWIFLLIRIITDIFRSHDLNGWTKAAWLLFVIILPFLGVLVYLIARGSDMQRRDVRQAENNEAAFRTYVQDAAGSGSTADELTKLVTLRDQGVLTNEEFAAQKSRILGQSAAASAPPTAAS
jgi:type VI protein secretion system component VasK